MLYFDGLDDFAVMRTDSFPTDRFTISLWLKCERTRPLQTIFTLFSQTAGRELELSDTMDLRVLRSADQATNSAGIFLADGRWHFVAVTWAQGYVKLIVDGEVLMASLNPASLLILRLTRSPVSLMYRQEIRIPCICVICDSVRL